MVDNFKLVESGHKDLEAAKLLYSNDYFSHAVFHTQQSIEKISKYLALESNAVKFEELQRKIGHNPVEAFRIAIESNIEMLSQVSALRKNDGSITPNFLNLDKVSSDIKTTVSFIKSYNLENLTEKNLNEIIEIINQVESGLGTDYFNKSEMMKMDFIEFTELLSRNHLISSEQKDELIGNLTNNQALKDFLNNYVRKFADCFPGYMAAILKMFFVSIPFAKHAVSSRYPDATKNFDPAEHYNSANPLVQRIPFFHETIENSIKSIVRYNISLSQV